MQIAEVHSCSCGREDAHVVARRLTADGIAVCAWSDGAITGALGFRLTGVPVVRPRTRERAAVERAAAALLLGEVELYDVAELGALYAACRKVARRGGGPGDVRAALAAERPF